MEVVNKSCSGIEKYYSVFIPDVDDGHIHVYTDKLEALKVMKQSKQARCKQFNTREEAVWFAENGDNNDSLNVTTPDSPVTEKPMPFKGPKPQSMIKFRKAIECGDTPTVLNEIKNNPRYLVSSGDTPSILQEGPRYNPLHVAAKSKNVEIARLILNTVSNVDFIQYLYNDSDVEACQQRANILLDLYLNMPDKGLNETPLHLAAKHGAVDVVELLVSYPQCQVNLPNKYKQTPLELTCTRVSNPTKESIVKIKTLLEGGYFVPVLKSEDNTIPPRVGEAFSPRRPLSVPDDPLSPTMIIEAYAGPMKKDEAEIFRKNWKTPNKLSDKNVEKRGKNLAEKLHVPWKKYWSFLDTFIDLSSTEGLNKLEFYLKNRFKETNENMIVDKESKIQAIQSPMSELCDAFQSCTLNSPMTCGNYQTHKLKEIKKNRNGKVTPEKRQEIVQYETVYNNCSSPLLCVEKACQVLGKRLAAAINVVLSPVDLSDIYNINIDSLTDSLEVEIKHSTSLINSFRDDPRFQSLDFSLIHSRISKITSDKLTETDKDEKKFLIKTLWEIKKKEKDKDEDESPKFRNIPKNSLDIKTYLLCIVDYLIDYLMHSPSIRSSSLQTERDCITLWNLETSSCQCGWGANIQKKYISKRLQFTDETPTKESNSDEEFGTPPSSPPPRDAEEMVDAEEPPDTFIYPGDIPSKTDFEVMEAIQNCEISNNKFPFIYKWKHLVELYPKFSPSKCKIFQSPNISFSSPNSTPPYNMYSSPVFELQNMDPWERILGNFSPRRSRKTSRVSPL